VALVAAVAAAATLVVRDPRRRAASTVGALVLAAVALAGVVGTHHVTHFVSTHTAEAAAGVLAGAVALGVLTWVFLRWPAMLGLLAVAALPFRVPVSSGGSTANLLLPLYGVIGAGVLAWLWRLRRESLLTPVAATPVRPSRRDGNGRAAAAAEPSTPAGRRVSRLTWAVAGVMVLYAVQSLYAPDHETAIKNVCFFYVPFAILFRLLADTRWTSSLLTNAMRLTVGLSLLFAVVGIGEWITGRLLLTNAKVLQANDLEPYFRVNSLFFDPNIYGRFLALTMVLLAAALLWTRRPRDVWAIAGALAVLWAGLVLSLSQSSFGALLLGLAVLAALRWRFWPIAGIVAAGGVAAIAIVLLAPGVVHIHGDSAKALDRATSGRVDLLRGGAHLFEDHPLVGVGSGGFAVSYRKREHVRSTRAVVVSHTIPVTVAAEQGIVGLAAYVWLLVAALAMLLGELTGRLRRADPGVPVVARAAVAAAFSALVLHTLVYAAYLEDPLSWALLAIGAALAAAPAERDERHGRAAAAPADATAPAPAAT
jgi:O-antigen ligase